MKLTHDTGHALIVHKGQIKATSFENGTQYPIFNIPNYDVVEIPDYYDNLDAYTRMSDDGHRFYETVHVLAESPTAHMLPAPGDFQVPNSEEMLAWALQSITPAVKALATEEMCTNDFTFALNILKTDAFLYSRWQKTKSIPAAQKQALKDIFRIH